MADDMFDVLRAAFNDGNIRPDAIFRILASDIVQDGRDWIFKREDVLRILAWADARRDAAVLAERERCAKIADAEACDVQKLLKNAEWEMFARLLGKKCAAECIAAEIRDGTSPAPEEPT